MHKPLITFNNQPLNLSPKGVLPWNHLSKNLIPQRYIPDWHQQPWQSIDGATLFSTSVWNSPQLPSFSTTNYADKRIIRHNCGPWYLFSTTNYADKRITIVGHDISLVQRITRINELLDTIVGHDISLVQRITRINELDTVVGHVLIWKLPKRFMAPKFPVSIVCNWRSLFVVGDSSPTA